MRGLDDEERQALYEVAIDGWNTDDRIVVLERLRDRGLVTSFDREPRPDELPDLEDGWAVEEWIVTDRGRLALRADAATPPAASLLRGA